MSIVESPRSHRCEEWLNSWEVHSVHFRTFGNRLGCTMSFRFVYFDQSERCSLACDLEHCKLPYWKQVVNCYPWAKPTCWSWQGSKRLLDKVLDKLDFEVLWYCLYCLPICMLMIFWVDTSSGFMHPSVQRMIWWFGSHSEVLPIWSFSWQPRALQTPIWRAACGIKWLGTALTALTESVCWHHILGTCFFPRLS